jgi:sugar lactone lactonase YvrE
MVIKFNPAGRVQMVFGRKKEASDEIEPWTRATPRAPAVDGQFRQPTDVAWDPQGNIYISDGYVNSRVAKYDKNGDWVKQWGDYGSGPDQMNTPHSIANDRQGNLYVADRGNARVKVYDGDGNLKKMISIDVPAPADAKVWFGAKPNPNAPKGQNSPGAPWAVCVSGGPTQYLFVADAFPGRIYKLSLDGKVLGMLGRTGRMPGTFGWIHEMACPSENELFVAEILNWRVQKLTLKPVK